MYYVVHKDGVIWAKGFKDKHSAKEYIEEDSEAFQESINLRIKKREV